MDRKLHSTRDMSAKWDPTPVTERTIRTIAKEIARDIVLTNQIERTAYARPYLTAMQSLTTLDDEYGADSASSVVAYFLANAAQWRGPTARRIKAELNAMLKAHRS